MIHSEGRMKQRQKEEPSLASTNGEGGASAVDGIAQNSAKTVGSRRIMRLLLLARHTSKMLILIAASDAFDERGKPGELLQRVLKHISKFSATSTISPLRMQLAPLLTKCL